MHRARKSTRRIRDVRRCEREEPDNNLGAKGANGNATVDDCTREECREQHASDKSCRLEENQSIHGSA